MSKTLNNIPTEIFATIVSIIAGLIIYLARLGFEQNVGLIIISILVSVYIIYLPVIVSKLLKSEKNNIWYTSKSFIHLLGLVTIFISGILNEILDIKLYYLFSILGIIFLISTYKISALTNKKIIKKNSHYFYMLVIFVLFSGWAITAYYSNFYSDPLIYEKIINGSWAHRDTMFHAAISGIIKTYGLVSTGLDGVNIPIYYHTYSHYLYGTLASLLQTNTLNFYTYVHPIIFIPFFFQAFTYCCSNLNKIFSKHEFKIENTLNYWILLFILFALPFNYSYYPETYHYFYSQSYLLSLAFSFSLFSILAVEKDFFKKKNLLKLSFSDFNKLLVILALFIAISISKLSFLYFIVTVFTYFYFRKKLFLNFFHNLILLGFFLISIVIYLKIVLPMNSIWSHHAVVDQDSYIRKFLDKNELYYMNLVGSITYIVLRFNYLKIFSLSKIFNLFKDSKLLDIELLVLLSLSLFIFPYIYTNGIQVYVASALLLSNIKTIPIVRYKYVE
jgi:hypothetical protein